MSVEYKNGTFGETRPIDEALEEFTTAIHDGSAKALHVGTYTEVEKEKAKADFQRGLEKAMEELSDRVDDLEKDESIIKPATPEEIAKITKND